MISRGELEATALSSSNRQKQDPTEFAYTGGSVLEPKKGHYHNLVVVDVASLYPTMAVLHNISFDTINCVRTPKANRVDIADSSFGSSTVTTKSCCPIVYCV